jgi:TonB family protein
MKSTRRLLIAGILAVFLPPLFVHAQDQWASPDTNGTAVAQPAAPNSSVLLKSDTLLGAKLTIPNLNSVLIRIDPGTFTMGSPASETGRGNDEVQHQVTLTKRYWMGEYDVTVGEFRAFVTATGYRTEAEMGDGMYVYTGSTWEKRAGASWQNPNLNQDDHHPVVGVSWNDAKAFCAWVNKTQTEAGRLPAGYEYTLPTEAQWEYACRAGTTEAYAGNLDSMGWYGQNSGNTTHPVGQKQPNAWGLYDMHGNVCEWCADWYGDYPGGNVTDPPGPSSGSFRVSRGGGWDEGAADCRSAYRGRGGPGVRIVFRGFRLALSSVSWAVQSIAHGDLTATADVVQPIEPLPPQGLNVGKVNINVQRTNLKDVEIFDLADLDQQPVPRFQPPTNYPTEMARNGIQGTVRIGFICDSEGHVQEAHVVTTSGSNELDQAAVSGVSKWLFTAGQKGGHAVNVRMEIPIAFNLEN